MHLTTKVTDTFSILKKTLKINENSQRVNENEQIRNIKLKLKLKNDVTLLSTLVTSINFRSLLLPSMKTGPNCFWYEQ